MTATIPPIAIQCPDWCTEAGSPNHEKPEVAWAEDGTYVISVGHDGPRFGEWSCSGEQNLTTGEWFRDVHLDTVNDGDRTAEELRQHIADTQAALAWLEAQR